jgi:hypothetical protein
MRKVPYCNRNTNELLLMSLREPLPSAVRSAATGAEFVTGITFRPFLPI